MLKPIGDMLTVLLFVGPLVLSLYALLKPRRQRTAAPGARRVPVASPEPAYQPIRRPPQLVVVGALLGRSVAWCHQTARESWRAFTTTIQLERQRVSVSSVLSSSPQFSDISDNSRIELLPAQPQNRPELELEPVAELPELSEGRRAAIRAVLTKGVPAGVLALAMGGNRSRRLGEIRQAMAERSESEAGHG